MEEPQPLPSIIVAATKEMASQANGGGPPSRLGLNPEQANDGARAGQFPSVLSRFPSEPMDVGEFWASDEDDSRACSWTRAGSGDGSLRACL
ncbi:hypothetical protein Dimus_039442 [Dionaea muscipula]